MSWHLSRRDFLGLALGTAAGVGGRVAFASTPTDTALHGLSAFGELKYPAGFERFDYANPAAPSGGTFSFAPPNWNFNQNVQTFNTLNSFVAKGDAPPRMELCFDSLMTRAIDEPDAVYGLLAESVTLSADRNTFTFRPGRRRVSMTARRSRPTTLPSVTRCSPKMAIPIFCCRCAR